MTDRTRPNVVVFISDQQRADTMPGVRRASVVETPHLEWLTRQGTLFTRAYATASICCPARVSLFSGLYPHQTGMVSNYGLGRDAPVLRLPSDVCLIADYLTSAGYACGYAGKWHLGSGGDRRGFDAFAARSAPHDVDGPEQNEFLRFAERAGMTVDPRYSAQVDPADYDRRTRTGSTGLPLAFHLSMQDAQRAGRFIYAMEGDERPFFLAYSCFEPHRPLACPRPFAERYSPQDMPLPETRRDAAGPELLRRRPDSGLAEAAQYSDDDLRKMWAAYYGSISYVDHLVGTILAALVETDQLDETLFVFTSDHGELLGSHGLLWKGSMLYEESVRVPLLIRPPRSRSEGSLPGRRSGRVVSHVDLLPTILGWCGVAPPADLLGEDLRPLVDGRDVEVHEGVAVEYHSHTWGGHMNPLRAWCTEDWKYVEGQSGGEELYHLAEDPQEARNLIDDPTAEHARRRMEGALREWVARSLDPWPRVVQPPTAGMDGVRESRLAL